MQDFQSDSECYEFIGNRLMEAVPDEWTQIRVEFERKHDGTSLKHIFYQPAGAGGDQRQFGIDDPAFDDCFHQLAYMTEDDWRGRFVKCRFVLNADGSFQTFFEYEQEDD